MPPQQTCITGPRPNITEEVTDDHVRNTDGDDYIRPQLTLDGALDPLVAPRGKLRTSLLRRESFLMEFATSRGPPQVVALCMLLALALGSTIGIVPAVVTDRYARLNHGYSDSYDCSHYHSNQKPEACVAGNNDAQNASALTSLVSNLLTFVTSSVIGSLSDEYGRKGILVLGIFLSLLGPTCVVLLQLFDEMTPTWYYVASGSTGLVNWFAVALSVLSDVIPPKWRAPSFGLLLAGFSLGFALSPLFAILFSHLAVSILSLALLFGGFIFSIFVLPETLSHERMQAFQQVRRQQVLARGPNETFLKKVIRVLVRPVKEISILNRNRLFRLLSTLAFFSGMVSTADHSLLLYYVEDQFDFGDRDIAIMFLIMGVLGMFVQGVLLKPMNDFFGERRVIIIAFLFGTLTNLLYGLATNKGTIFVALGMSVFIGVSFPTISAIKSNNVNESEQGRIQGALYSLSALASAVGPLSLRAVYNMTKNDSYPGPGIMFVFAAVLYFVAVLCAIALPRNEANSSERHKDTFIHSSSEEPLLPSSSESYGSDSSFSPEMHNTV
uniref:Major facilitator superfamily (MFS) profile domain-containing protein n=1 Tax=Attheya septentrionalis TaxID=420275 RepID=A0A7S2XRJ3_9STRA|mmetsp:Transcript_3194/g.5804  ORF Transcript_3194/g.5804 Transcript_3194/m.5804 type:complete len:554 (+) Transcript_3194:226-1887(+)